MLALDGALGGVGASLSQQEPQEQTARPSKRTEAEIRAQLDAVKREGQAEKIRRDEALAAWDREHPEPFRRFRIAAPLVSALVRLGLPEDAIEAARDFAPEIETGHALAVALDSLPSDPGELLGRICERAGIDRDAAARRADEHRAWTAQRNEIEAPHGKRLAALDAKSVNLTARLREIAEAKAAEEAERERSAKDSQAIGKAPLDAKGGTLASAVAEMLARGRAREDVLREALVALRRVEIDPPGDWVAVLVHRLKRDAAATRGRQESERLEAAAAAAKIPETEAGRAASRILASIVEHGPGALLSPEPEHAAGLSW